MSQFEVEIRSDLSPDPDLNAIARQAVESTLRHQGIHPPASLTVLLADDSRLQQLNRDFLGYDEPTDVLSFPAGESWPGVESYIGDIAVSLPRARIQASKAGHAFENELSTLIIHGVLHLLEYDHATKTEKRRMWSAQAEILELLLGDSLHSDSV